MCASPSTLSIHTSSSLHLSTSLLFLPLYLYLYFNTLISLSRFLFTSTSTSIFKPQNNSSNSYNSSTIHNATQSERLQFHTGKQSQQQRSGGHHRSRKSNNQSRPQTSGSRPQQGRPNIRWDAAVWLGQTTLEVVVLFTNSNWPTHLPQLLHRFDSKETRIPFYTRVTKGKKKWSRPREKKQKKKTGKKRKVRRWSTYMIWGDHWTPKPPFFGLSSPSPTLFSFPLFSPLTRSGHPIVWFSGFFGISPIHGASVPFSLFWLLASPESLRLPGFSRLHSSPLVSLFWRRLALCFLLVSLLSARVHSLWSPSYTLPFYLLPFQLYWLLLKLHMFVSRSGYLSASCMVMLWGLIGLTPYFVSFVCCDA